MARSDSSGSSASFAACTLATLVLASLAGAQPPRGYPGNFSPRNTAVGGTPPLQTAFFSANDGVTGVEPWFLAAGLGVAPTLLANIAPGSVGSFPEEFTPVDNQRVFFTARASVDQMTRFEDRELYYFDATALPALVQIQSSPGGTGGIRPGNSGSVPLELTLVGSQVFFSADDGSGFGRELWVSDGVSGLAVRVSDINGAGSSWPHNLIALDSTTVLFAATDALGDTELYKSDGTPGGTTIVANINPGAAGSYPGEMALFGGRVYFAATMAGEGRELWETNGTPAGTRMALPAGLRPGAESSAPDQLVPGSPTSPIPMLGFTALDSALGRTLWLYIPAIRIAGPVPVHNGHTIANLIEAPLGPLGPAWWYTYDDPALGNEIGFFLPGLGGGMFDVNPGATGSDPTSLRTLPGGELLFRADDGASGQELFKISTSGPIPVVGSVMDIRSGVGPMNAAGIPVPKSSFASPFVPFNGSYLFAAEGDNLRRALWQTNGTALGTSMVTAAAGTPSCNLHGFVDESVPGMSMLTWSLTDATPGSLVFFGFGTQALTKPQPFPGIGGALLLNPNLPVSVVPVGNAGNAVVAIPVPAFTTLVIGTQALCMNTVNLPALTNLDPCQTTVGSGALPGGAMANATGCFNDESGEYNINLRRTDAVGGTSYHALVYTRPSGEQVLLIPEGASKDGSFSMEAGEEINIQGFADLFPADDSGDTSGTKSVDLWMLVEPYTPQSTAAPPAGTNCTASGCIVWSSYC